MSHLFRAILVTFTFTSGAGMAVAQLHPYATTFANGSDAHALVSVEVTTVEKLEAGGTQATLKILHVYSGPRYLKGLGIFAETANGGNRAGGLVTPLLKVGEIGTATLAVNNLTGTWDVRGVARKDRVSDYDQLLEWSATIEKLAKLDVTKRLIAARELCGDKNARIAQLGVQVLFIAKPEDAKRASVSEFFTELPEVKGVTAAALVAADHLLIGRDRKQWLDSDRRKALVARFTEPLSDDDAVKVTDHVVSSRYIQSPDGTWFTAEVAATLLTKIATDPRQSKAVRQIVVTRVVEVANNAGVKADFTFDVLAAVVRGGIDNGVRLAAANGLARFKWGDPAQIGTLRALLTGEKDAEITKALEAAIDKSK